MDNQNKIVKNRGLLYRAKRELVQLRKKVDEAEQLVEEARKRVKLLTHKEVVLYTVGHRIPASIIFYRGYVTPSQIEDVVHRLNTYPDSTNHYVDFTSNNIGDLDGISEYYHSLTSPGYPADLDMNNSDERSRLLSFGTGFRRAIKREDTPSTMHLPEYVSPYDAGYMFGLNYKWVERCRARAQEPEGAFADTLPSDKLRSTYNKLRALEGELTPEEEVMFEHSFILMCKEMSVYSSTYALKQHSEPE